MAGSQLLLRHRSQETASRDCHRRPVRTAQAFEPECRWPCYYRAPRLRHPATPSTALRSFPPPQQHRRVPAILCRTVHLPLASCLMRPGSRMTVSIFNHRGQRGTQSSSSAFCCVISVPSVVKTAARRPCRKPDPESLRMASGRHGGIPQCGRYVSAPKMSRCKFFGQSGVHNCTEGAHSHSSEPQFDVRIPASGRLITAVDTKTGWFCPLLMRTVKFLIVGHAVCPARKLLSDDSGISAVTSTERDVDVLQSV